MSTSPVAFNLLIRPAAFFAPEHLILDNFLPAFSLAVIRSIFAAPFMITCHTPEMESVLVAIID